MATLYRQVDAAEAAREDLESWIEATQNKSLLRFITCGSVDDGKSTLIGRLLYDSKLLLDDQLASLASDSRKYGTQGEALDFALLVDGLSAEREQGITIDVAYRFFATDKRKFIVADTPGHEQYTRNMVTGASTADLAVILVDARNGLLTQTRRHSFLVHLLGIRHIVLAVNKMDLVGYDESVFTTLVSEYRDFAREVGIADFTAIPLSGLRGDNIKTRSHAMPWYNGPALLEHLETVPAIKADAAEPFRMAIQWVSRPDHRFRGYAGRIASGRIRIGDPVVVLPGGRRTCVKRILAGDQDKDLAIAGQSVTLALADEIDCSRGDVIVSTGAAANSVQRIRATLVWMAEEALIPHRSYWLKTGAQTLSSRIDVVRSIVDVNSLAEGSGETLRLNDVGRVEIDLDRRIPAVRYGENRKLGGFILIDKLTRATVAAGLIDDTADGPELAFQKPANRIHWVTGTKRSAWASRTAERIRSRGYSVAILDEAAVAAFGSPNMVRTAREAARLLADHGIEVFVTLGVAPPDSRAGDEINSDIDDDGEYEWVI